jgi:hypothetical protein
MFFTRDIMNRCSFERKIITALLLLLPGIRLAAQFDVFPGDRRTRADHVLVSQEVDTSGKIAKFGPNRLFFISPYAHFAFMPGPQVYGAQTNWWSSSFGYGLRAKLKLFYWNSIVLDAIYRGDRYSMRQNTPKLAPLTTQSHVRERISLSNFSIAFCDRINFRKRGNVLGNWLDFGVYGDNVFRSTNVFVDEHYDSNSPAGYRHKQKTTLVRLPYIETINYGFTLRWGGEFGSFFVQYRVNDIFNYDSPNNRDLPKLMIGMAFSGWN